MGKTFSHTCHDEFCALLNLSRLTRNVFSGNKLFLINLVIVISSERKRNFLTVQDSLKCNIKSQFFSTYHVIKLS